MEQVTGGRYTARSMFGERRKRRTSEGLGDEEGVGYPDGMMMTWEITDCAILGIVFSVAFCLLPRSRGSLCT
jgi:hypothetical protein